MGVPPWWGVPLGSPGPNGCHLATGWAFVLAGLNSPVLGHRNGPSQREGENKKGGKNTEVLIDLGHWVRFSEDPITISPASGEPPSNGPLR